MNWSAPPPRVCMYARICSNGQIHYRFKLVQIIVVVTIIVITCVTKRCKQALCTTRWFPGGRRGPFWLWGCLWCAIDVHHITHHAQQAVDIAFAALVAGCWYAWTISIGGCIIDGWCGEFLLWHGGVFFYRFESVCEGQGAQHSMIYKSLFRKINVCFKNQDIEIFFNLLNSPSIIIRFYFFFLDLISYVLMYVWYWYACDFCIGGSHTADIYTNRGHLSIWDVCNLPRGILIALAVRFVPSDPALSAVSILQLLAFSFPVFLGPCLSCSVASLDHATYSLQCSSHESLPSKYAMHNSSQMSQEPLTLHQLIIEHVCQVLYRFWRPNFRSIFCNDSGWPWKETSILKSFLNDRGGKGILDRLIKFHKNSFLNIMVTKEWFKNCASTTTL